MRLFLARVSFDVHALVTANENINIQLNLPHSALPPYANLFNDRKLLPRKSGP